MIPSPLELKRLHALLIVLHERTGDTDVYRRTGSVRVFDQGGGDHAVFVDGELPFLRAFDHESPASLHARDDQAPHPDVTVGVPSVVTEFHTDRYVADERTWVAWWKNDQWESRGDDPYPADALWPDAAALVDSMACSGFSLTLSDAQSLLEGELAPQDVALVPQEAAKVDLPGWTPGARIHVEVRAASPISGIGAIKAVRSATQGALGEIKAALAQGTALATVVAGPFEFDAARLLGAIRTGLLPFGEVAFRAGMTPDTLQPITVAELQVALGVSGSYLDRS